ncbi:MAG TPA: DMT family transporter [Clostridiales bacterium]|nr:DMT family transporter [Clostridiales bacterium]
MNIPRKLYFLVAVVAGATWGTHGTFARLMGQYGISDNVISVLCPLFCGLFFLVLLWKDNIRKIIFSLKFIPVLVFYGLSSALFNYSTIQAYWHMPVGIVHTVVFCNLFLLMPLSRLFFKEPMSWNKIVSACVAVVGIAMALNIFAADVKLSFTGVVWTLLAMVGWTALVMFEKYLLVKEFDGNVMLVLSSFFATVFLSFFAPPGQVVSEIVLAVKISHGIVLLPLAGFAFITTALSYYCYLIALKRMEPAIVQLGYISDPLTALILGFFIFDQSLLPVQIIGVLLIISVVVWIQWLEVKAERAAASTTQTE